MGGVAVTTTIAATTTTAATTATATGSPIGICTTVHVEDAKQTSKKMDALIELWVLESMPSQLLETRTQMRLESNRPNSQNTQQEEGIGP
jgi:hypothetical protein